MGFTGAIKSGFSHYVTFSGRAARSEYWYWVLFGFIVAVVSAILDGVIFPYSDTGPIEVITSLALLLPGVAMSVRRLHDIDRTGWWVLITFTGIGVILLIIWACFKGTTGSNRFGPDPLPAV
jgi:uncharacterized membrane protein YhaH (DUF805 family)